MIRAWKLSKTANRSNVFSKKTKQPVKLGASNTVKFNSQWQNVYEYTFVYVVRNFLLNNTILPYSIIRLRRNWSSGKFACSEYSKLLPQTFAHLHSELNEATKRSRLSQRGEKGRDAT